MEENNMVENVDNYYDGTTDEEFDDTSVEDTENEADPAEDDTEDLDNIDDNENAEEFADDDAEEESNTEETDNEVTSADDTPTAEVTPVEKVDSDLELAAKELLKSLLGDNVGDPVKAMKTITAETLGITYDELERRTAQTKAENEAWQQQAKRDIEAIHEAFPASRKYKTLMDLPNRVKFANLMDNEKTKLTAVEAFAASHPDIVTAQNKYHGKKNDLSGTKSHMTSNVPRGAKDNSTPMSKSEMESFKEMFPNLSSADIKKLYKRINN